jgi:two-component system, NarL family, nitrate/nitrite response regulator NarL
VTTANVEPVGVTIAIEHPLVRDAVRRSCDRIGIVQVLAEVADTKGLLSACRERPPQVIVLDDDLDGGRGLEALRAIREEGVSAGVLVLTDRTDGASVLDALKLGVRGYLGKADGLRQVGEAVSRIAAGERLIDPELEQAAVMALGEFARHAREGSQVQATLTPREHQILLMVSDGSTMQQVASRLGISPRTVETHVAKLYRKLGVRSRVQAVARAAQLGLIDL